MSITQIQMPAELRLVVVGEEWAARFLEERSRIAEALAGSALDIQRLSGIAGAA